MVCRLIEGWESSAVLTDYAGKWTTLSGSFVAGRFGNAWRATSSGHNATRAFDNQATWIVGFAFRPSAMPAVACDILAFKDSAVIHGGLAIQPSTGLLLAFRGTTSTILGTSSAGITVNTWNYIEVKYTVNDTTGSVVIRLNGAAVLTLTNVDTRNAGNATANTVVIGPNANPGGVADYDDIYICDGTGTTNNDFLGDCKVEQVLPTGAGATTAWTPSAGSNYDCVNEVPPNGDTDYVSSATAGQTDTYAFSDLGVASGAVKAVQATVSARKDDAGSRSLAVVARPGSTDRVGATKAVGDTYAAYPQVWDTNPDTAAAWTVADVNSSQFGIRLIA